MRNKPNNYVLMCRIDNLLLVPESLASSWCEHSNHSPDLHTSSDTKEGNKLDQEMSLYFMAMQQLPFDPADEVRDKCNSCSNSKL